MIMPNNKRGSPMIQTQHFYSICVAASAAWMAIATITWAQQPGDTKSGAETVAASSPTTDATAKEILMASPLWKEMYAEFQKWLSSQTIYTDADVQRINANLTAQLRAMPVSELEGFLNDWQAKLDVLQGRDFQDAQQWLGQYLSAFADGFRRRTLQNLGLGDITQLSARELENAMLNARADRMAAHQRQNAFNESRSQMIQNARQSNAAARDARQQSRTGGARFGTNQSPYRPPRFDPPPPPRRQFFVDQYGRINFFLP